MVRFLPVLTLFVASLPPGVAAAPAPTVIEKAADLPSASYPVSVRPSDLLIAPDPEFLPFQSTVERDLRDLLQRFDIRDVATRALYVRALAQIEFMNGRLAEAERGYVVAASLETKPDARAFSGIQQRALISAERSGAARGSAAYAASYRQAFSAGLSPLDPALVTVRVNFLRQSTLQSLDNVYVGLARESIDPLAAQKSLPREAGLRLIDYRFRMRHLIPLKRETLAVLRQYSDAHPVPDVNIWRERAFSLDGRSGLTPVRVAVWDTGFDPALFPDKLLIDSRGDPVTIGFDRDHRASSGYLKQLTPEQLAGAARGLRDLSGLGDQAAGRDTPDALAVQDRIAKIAPDDVPAFLEGINVVGDYAHGTMVTTLIADTNPAIRLANIRNDFDTREVSPPETLESAQATAAKYRAIGDFLKLHRIKLVNLSWAGTVADVEQSLVTDPAYSDPAKRRDRAAMLFGIMRDAFAGVVAANPGILFIAGAGNSNNDTNFLATYPSGVDLPNLLVVGGVNRAGDPMGMSAFGKTIKVAANGEDIRALVPGGGTIVNSGTSFSAPQVTNLAAKLLALYPDLTPGELVALITSSAAAKTPQGIPLINPRLTAERAQAGQRSKR